MSDTFSVHVTGISPSLNKEKLHDFFSFCGKITSIDQEDDKATVHFEKVSAAKTALMLSGGTLDGATLQVTGDHLSIEEKEETPHPKDTKVHEIDQHDKPRAGIAAEYIAHGYQLTDHVLGRLIDLDQKQGISKRFLSYMQHIDTKVGERALGPEQTISGKLQATLQSATQQAKAIDEQKGFSKVANDYYVRALSSPWGQKVKDYYTTTSKQVQDVHEEARRIVDQQKQSKATATQGASGSSAAHDSKTQAAPTVV